MINQYVVASVVRPETEGYHISSAFMERTAYYLTFAEAEVAARKAAANATDRDFIVAKIEAVVRGVPQNVVTISTRA